MILMNLRMCKSLLFGIAIGLTLSLTLHQFSNHCRSKTFGHSDGRNLNLQYELPPLSSKSLFRPSPLGYSDQPIPEPSQSQYSDILQPSIGTSEKKLVLIGVMTANKYLGTRATAVYNTWARNFAGKIIFFTGGNVSRPNGEVPVESTDVPLVPLPGVDDSYPPQKKSFMMLKYMLDNYGNEYEWFLRADDDVYIHTPKLENFIRSLNSNHLYFIGQAGRGSLAERGRLNLAHDENFCMGGPGILFSQAMLKKVGPHVSECLKDMYSTHEDVEVGRCVHRFAGISCTWAYEMQSIFYHNSSGDRAFTEDLKHREVHRAITLHPVKHPDHLYRLHSYFQEREIEKRFYEAILLQRDLLLTQTELRLVGQLVEHQDFITEFDECNITGLPPSLRKFSPAQISDIPEWSFVGKSGFNAPNSINPRQKIDGASKEALRDVIRELMEMINSLSKVRGRVIEFKDLLYGYHRVDPLHGEDFVLDILMTYRKYRGKKMTVPVRRHAYIQRPFAPLQVRFVTQNVERPGKLAFIVPLSGRLVTFQRFLLNYQFVCEKMFPEISDGRLVLDLIVVYFGNDQKEEFVSLITAARQNHLHSSCPLNVVHVQAEFSRGVGLETGISQCHEDDLLFLVDVDIAFSPEAVRRILQNTIQGTQVYFPIVFSEYSNDLFPADLETDPGLFQISTDTGYWREFGFGIAAFFKSDFMKVSGFDVSIRGWGKEDVALFDQFLQTNLTVFRSPDPELLHMYHPIQCASDLPHAQYEMCLGSRASTLGSPSNLLKFIFKNRKTSKTLAEVSKFLFLHKSER